MIRHRDLDFCVPGTVLAPHFADEETVASSGKVDKGPLIVGVGPLGKAWLIAKELGFEPASSSLPGPAQVTQLPSSRARALPGQPGSSVCFSPGYDTAPCSRPPAFLSHQLLASFPVSSAG